MSIFNLLPLEIIRQILLLLERKSIIIMHKYLSNNKLDLEEILKTRQIVAYPRTSGKCLRHSPPQDLICKLYTKSPDRFSNIVKYFNENDNNIDLVKGDLFKIDAINSYIFDGNTLIMNNYDFDEFHVIENNVPIYYWKDYSSIAYFNHNLVKDQCISNIKYELLINNKYGIFTSFIYDKTKYNIIYDYMQDEDAVYDSVDGNTYEILDNEIIITIIENFKAVLSCTDAIAFWLDSEFYGDIDNSLFICMHIS